MRITIELRRPTRRSMALVLGALLLVTPAAVLGGHQFSDVPQSHPFHHDIDWMAANGIANGFDDGTYRPAEPLTRQAVAAFIHRLSNATETIFYAVDHGPATFFSYVAECPNGKRPISGGGHISANDTFLSASSPTGSGWSLTWQTEDNATVDPGLMGAYVVCAPPLL